MNEHAPLPDTYEAAYAELQQLLQDLQNEAVGIDELSAKLARAADLIRFCRERLRQTEAEVARLNEALGDH